MFSLVLVFILGAVVTILSTVFGIFLALILSKSEAYERVSERLPKKKESFSLIERPTAEEIKRGTIEEAGQEEFSSLLRKIFNGPNHKK